MSEYMRLLLLSLSVPLCLSFWPPLRFYRSFKAFIISDALILLFFGGWDIFAVYRGHWSFSADKVFPLRVVNLPLEELLFFIVIPFCCLFTWEALLYLLKQKR